MCGKAYYSSDQLCHHRKLCEKSRKLKVRNIVASRSCLEPCFSARALNLLCQLCSYLLISFVLWVRECQGPKGKNVVFVF